MVHLPFITYYLMVMFRMQSPTHVFDSYFFFVEIYRKYSHLKVWLWTYYGQAKVYHFFLRVNVYLCYAVKTLKFLCICIACLELTSYILERHLKIIVHRTYVSLCILVHGLKIVGPFYYILSKVKLLRFWSNVYKRYITSYNSKTYLMVGFNLIWCWYFFYRDDQT